MDVPSEVPSALRGQASSLLAFALELVPWGPVRSLLDVSPNPTTVLLRALGYVACVTSLSSTSMGSSLCVIMK